MKTAPQNKPVGEHSRANKQTERDSEDGGDGVTGDWSGMRFNGVAEVLGEASGSKKPVGAKTSRHSGQLDSGGVTADRSDRQQRDM